MRGLHVVPCLYMGTTSPTGFRSSSTLPAGTVNTSNTGRARDMFYVTTKVEVPSTEAEWQQISLEFAQRWNLPNCIGAIDGKHVAIRSPGGSTHYNYLKFHSIILLAVVDAKYRFLYFNVGANGRAGDAGVFRDSTLAAALENNTLNIPTPVPLPGRVTPVPYLL
ncbi:hypothetical protein C0Q70_04797 [Pomacea canaliculata]|uniref:DDE Tnp4 domain-containing protein n=1 Tax=Pomacea canaliculata TaxID=400727 RepID=A0A2T7PJF7_POMCA|nr:hypothetical protein C0Q70_04797 [Pomacea canaliculata]